MEECVTWEKVGKTRPTRNTSQDMGHIKELNQVIKI